MNSPANVKLPSFDRNKVVQIFAYSFLFIITILDKLIIKICMCQISFNNFSATLKN